MLFSMWMRRAFLFLCLVAMTLVPFQVVFAAAGTGVPTTGPVYITFIPNLFNCQQLDCVVGKLLDALAKIAAPFVAIMVLVGAFQIITAGGDPDKFTNGRKTILYAVIGYAIILLASSVVPIINSLLGVKTK